MGCRDERGREAVDARLGRPPVSDAGRENKRVASDFLPLDILGQGEKHPQPSSSA